MARPTKLTPARHEAIVQAVRDGNYFATACAGAGVAEATGYEWLARGEGTDRRRPRDRGFAEFAEAVRRAEAEAETDAVALIRQGFADNPRLALDYLARRHPDRWGQRDTLTVLQKLVGEVRGMSDDDLLAVVGRGVAGAGPGAVGGGGGPPAGAAGPGPLGNGAPAG
jgi:hypothetical protein